MSNSNAIQSVGAMRPRPDGSRNWLFLSFVVFFGGGVPALIYQVVWQRVLSLYFGVDIYSTTIAVTVFMLGLGIGSFAGGWLADRLRSVVMAYAIVEVLIALFGLASLQFFSLVGASFAGSSLGMLILVDSLLLLLPTCLMGMTLPLMTRVVVDSQASIGPRLARLYGLNTLGAAVGAIVSSYWLIGSLGMDGALRVAVAINLLLAAAMFVLVRGQRPDLDEPGQAGTDLGLTTASDSIPDRQADDHPMYSLPLILACAFLSGFIALGNEIVWYRIVRVLLHGTVYVFGTVLFVFLLGIALGAIAAQKRIARPGWLQRFAWCQLGAAAWVFLFFMSIGHFSDLPGLRHLVSASFFIYFHPSLELVAGEISLASLYSALDVFFWTAAILLVPTFLMGYGFPNLMRAGSSRVASVGRSVGNIYLANIVGSALGSLIVGFVLIHRFGSERTLQIMILLGAISAMMILQVSDRRDRRSTSRRVVPLRTIAPIVLILFTLFTFPERMQIIKAVHLADFPIVTFSGLEDRTGVVALRDQSDVVAFAEEKRVLGRRRLYIDGSAHGGISEEVGFDDEVQAAMSAHPRPTRVLSIGLGDGRMVAAAATRAGVDEIVVVELNESLRKLIASTPQGGLIEEHAGKMRYVVDDGRRWLLANPDEKFDVVMMWPLHAAHAYSGSLFSMEFMQIIARHLRADGLLIVRSADGYSTARTVATVFDQTVRLRTQTYVAANSPLIFDRRRIESTTIDLASLITADKTLILKETELAPLNRDTRPNSEYYLTYPFAKHMARGATPLYASPGGSLNHFLAQ